MVVLQMLVTSYCTCTVSLLGGRLDTLLSRGYCQLSGGALRRDAVRFALFEDDAIP
jgi:hypothetical protein